MSDDGPRKARGNPVPLCLFFPKKSKTLEFSMRVIASPRNSAVEKNSFVLKKSYKRYTLIENILLEIKKKSNE